MAYEVSGPRQARREHERHGSPQLNVIAPPGWRPSEQLISALADLLVEQRLLARNGAKSTPTGTSENAQTVV